MKKSILLCVLVFPVLSLFSRERTADRKMVASYVRQWKDIARTEMVRTGVPASITLAQAIVESGASQRTLSVLAREGNNLFGIKCHQGWQGKYMLHDDDRKNERFRVYESIEASFQDHSNFLATRSNYRPLFRLSMYDYRGWAYGLKRAGYATDRLYAQKLIRVIESYHLYRYDRFTERVPTD